MAPDQKIIPGKKAMNRAAHCAISTSNSSLARA